VQFASFLGDLEQRSRRAEGGPPPSLWRALVSQPRRLVEVLADFAIICASFLAAYLLQVDDRGTDIQRSIFLAALPVLVAVRYVLFVVFGVYRRVWRFGSALDLLAVGAAVWLSVPLTILIVRARTGLGTFPLEIFVVDALLCTGLVAASRLALRLVPELAAKGGRRGDTRIVLVGAGRSGRSLARELGETPGRRVVGFLDDNPSVRRRRVFGIKVLGDLDEAAEQLPAVRAEEVLVTIPDAPTERLAAVQRAAQEAGVPYRVVRRTFVAEPPFAEATTE
jgi:FlaA1/EpsC-like NDP-sugar epimerase